MTAQERRRLKRSKATHLFFAAKRSLRTGTIDSAVTESLDPPPGATGTKRKRSASGGEGDDDFDMQCLAALENVEKALVEQPPLSQEERVALTRVARRAARDATFASDDDVCKG